MEDVLDVYHRSHNPRRPVGRHGCIDRPIDDNSGSPRCRRRQRVRIDGLGGTRYDMAGSDVEHQATIRSANSTLAVRG
jgi:hypothetical protein